LLSVKNKHKLLKAGSSILDCDLYELDSEIIIGWQKVYRGLIEDLSFSDVKTIAVPFLLELNKISNPINKRIIASRMFTWIAATFGDEAFTEEPIIKHALLAILSDTNWKIRIIAAKYL
jgi:hypothetical protein